MERDKLSKKSQDEVKTVIDLHIIDLHYEGKLIYEISELLNLPEAYVVNVLERGGYVVK